MASEALELFLNLLGCGQWIVTLSLERAGTIFRCGSRGPSLEVCGYRLWAQKSENTKSAYEWRLGYGRPEVQPKRELLGL